MDRQLRHPLVLACDAERLLFDFASYLGKIEKALFDVKELTPLVAARGVDKLEDKRATGHDTLTAREKVATDDASKMRKQITSPRAKKISYSLFKNTGFTRGLTADL
jgi:hypothetical protein